MGLPALADQADQNQVDQREADLPSRSAETTRAGRAKTPRKSGGLSRSEPALKNAGERIMLFTTGGRDRPGKAWAFRLLGPMPVVKSPTDPTALLIGASVGRTSAVTRISS